MKKKLDVFLGITISIIFIIFVIYIIRIGNETYENNKYIDGALDRMQLNLDTCLQITKRLNKNE